MFSAQYGAPPPQAPGYPQQPGYPPGQVPPQGIYPQVPPPPGGVQYPQGPPPVQPVQVVTVVQAPRYGKNPMTMTCPHCSSQIQTSTKSEAGPLGKCT